MNDLDPLLHDAMARVRGPVDARPSLTDVRRRARRHNRRRMTATVGVVACAGVGTAALIIRRDSVDSTGVASAPVDSVADGDGTSTVHLPALGGDTTTTFPTTTMPPAQVVIDATLVWDALENLRSDPTAIGFVAALDSADRSQMPTAEAFNCTTDGCVCMLIYVVWHEVAGMLRFPDMQSMAAYNRAVDFSQLPREGDVLLTPSSGASPMPTIDPNNETPTTLSLFDGVVLIDGGAPAGAMEDAYQRLPGYNRVIVPSAGKTVEQTMVMPIGDNTALASAVAGVFGIGGLDTWDPSYIGTPIEGMVAVVIGPDYFDLVADTGSATTTVSPTTSTTTATTTTIVG